MYSIQPLQLVIAITWCWLPVLGYIVPTPPTFPGSFSVSFQEIEVLGTKVLSSNNGTWYYDYTHGRARFDHGQGQTNNFCDFQGLSPKDPRSECHLIFTPTYDLFVHYPYAGCCRLCGKEEGCTVLKPDWLHEGTVKLLSVEIIGGRKCWGYGKPGAVASYDTWFADVGGLPCRYHEVVEHIDHNLTFFADSFKAGPLDDELFQVPDFCHRTCPHPYKPPH